MKRFLALGTVMLLSVTMLFAQSRRINNLEIHKKKATVSLNLNKAKALAQSNDTKTVINDFPYHEGFENGLGDWTLVDSDGDGFNWMLASDYELESEYVHNGEDCVLSMSYDNDSGDVLYPDNWLISSLIQLPSEGGLDLSWFDAALDGDYPADHYSVYIASGNSIATFLATDAVVSYTLSTDEWTKRTVNLDAYAGQDVYVAFRHHDCYDEFIMMIDDIAIMEAGMPTVSLHGPNTVIAGNAATFTATCDVNNATLQWTLEGATPSTATGNSVVATWPEPGTYTITVAATNEVGTAEATMTVSVLDCSNPTLPYFTDFEALGSLGCWTAIDANNDGLTWDYEEDFGAINYSWDEEEEEGITPDDYLVSPALSLPQGGSCQLSYTIAPAGLFDYEEHYSVYVSTTGCSVSDFTDCLLSETFDGEEWYYERSIDISQYAGHTVYIAFRHHDCYDQMALSIYDVTVTATEGSSENTSHAAVNLYPNPTNGIVNVEGDGILGVEVVDITGRTIMSQQSAGCVDLSQLPDGVYAIRVRTEKGVSLQKVTKR